MTQGSDGYHEPIEWLSKETIEVHRALISLMEELEAIDWYQQRADACTDEDLKAILLHNKVEEMEHAMMSLEWILRRDPAFAKMARTYLFQEGPIVKMEQIETGKDEGGSTNRAPSTRADGCTVAMSGNQSTCEETASQSPDADRKIISQWRKGVRLLTSTQ